jgi:hypothetical protein
MAEASVGGLDMDGFGLGPPASGYVEATQWLHPPERHRNSLDDDLEGASGGDGDEPSRFARIAAAIRRVLRRR